MGHGAAAFLALSKRLFQFPYFRPLKVTNLHGHLLNGSTANCNGRYEGRMAITLQHLGGNFCWFKP